MELLLWRHAEAEDGLPDLERPLSAKGHKQAGKVAAWLDRNLPGNCRVLASPALRTQQTAAALGRKYKTLADLAPNASVADVLEAAGWPEARESALIVGHQPTLGWVAGELLGVAEGNVIVKKGAVWWFSNRDRGDGPRVSLRAVVSPELL